MGEEKPDEELMGKRKSSPRLSTTFGDVDTTIVSGMIDYIPLRRKKVMIFWFFNLRRIVVRYRQEFSGIHKGVNIHESHFGQRPGPGAKGGPRHGDAAHDG